MRLAIAATILWVLWVPASAPAYSVLTHEAIIDTLWKTDIVPLLRARFPRATPEELQNAQAYAYGGCIIQDLGYYPFGSKFFSDLVHYVRTGDFVEELLAQSRNLNEYAFALGALAHYAADTVGHPEATNRAVPLEYPKLRREYGNSIPYGAEPGAHIKVEFGFDVLQVAKGRYAPKSYHDFIGFEVSKDLLELVFPAVYGIELKDALASVDLAIGSYRFAIARTIPFATKVAWEKKRDQISASEPGATRDKFVYNLSTANYHQEWGRDYRRPGVGAKILAFLGRLIPKIGPFKPLALKMPSPDAERLFMQSFNDTLERAREMLTAVRSGYGNFRNRDFDTGKLTAPGEYDLSDKTHAKLARKLADGRFVRLAPAARRYLLGYFSGRELPASIRKDDRRETLAAINALKAGAIATDR